MTVHELLTNPPTLHMDERGLPISYSLATDVLEFIDQHVHESAVTLETGAGISTIVFGLKGGKHTCIVPDAAQVARIQRYCSDHAIAIHNIRFVVDTSERALPLLQFENLELVLIDGRHGFPTPFIDWFYAASHLRVGGILIIDDVQLWTCRVLKEFLAAEPEWDLTQEFARTAIFTKLKDGGEWKEWNHQKYTLINSMPV